MPLVATCFDDVIAFYVNVLDVSVCLFLSNLDNCSLQLGMKNRRIKNGQITASSLHVNTAKPPGYHGAQHARLYTMESNDNCGGWHASLSDTNPWIQVNLQGVTWVSGVMIQGRNSNRHNQWVKQFKVLYRMYGLDWVTVQTQNKEEMVRKYVNVHT